MVMPKICVDQRRVVTEQKELSMKIIGILGSPHGWKGSTAILLKELARGAEESGTDVTLFSLNECEVKPCSGCDACHKTGACIIKDDFPRILAALETADGIVLASPNYIFNVSAQLKALLDRCCGPIHLQSMSGKYGAAVVTSGGPGSAEIETYLLRVMRSLGCWTVGSVGCLGAQLQQPKTGMEHLAAAAELGRQLATAIRAQQKYPEQEAERQAFFQRMKELVCWRRDEWPHEFQFWIKHGRL
jgi:multimeric flavodoxin WrbA